MPQRQGFPGPFEIAQLVPSRTGYTFFRHKDKGFPDEGDNGFSLLRAWWLAEASLLAYQDRGRIQQEVGNAGWSCWIPHAFEKPSTQFFAMSTGNVCIIAFRGTQLEPPEGVLQDVMVDADFVARPAGGDGAVHRGFLRESEKAAELIRHQLPPEFASRQIWFTGHSLGAALAVVTASLPRIKAAGIYAFGMPMVGNSAFNATIGDKVWRVVHANDGVVSLPPANKLYYAPVGSVRYLTREGEWRSGAMTALDGVADFFSKPWAKPVLGIGTAISDHAPLYYAGHLYNKLL